jgi:hypothetical protein
MSVSASDIEVKKIAANSMKLDEIYSLPKNSENATDGDKFQNWDQSAELLGNKIPLVTINGYNVSRYMDTFDLSLNGFLPVLRFSFDALDASFISINYPKDGDLVSVYIKTNIDVYLPLRMDFNVLSVHSELTSKVSETGYDPKGMGRNMRFTILAECRIPGLYTHRSRSFGAQTSFDTLLDVAQEIGLGFSSNESTTDDLMTWLCPNYSYYDFIKDICQNSFKDDRSFFDVFVDCYYNLNFINLGTQFEFERNPETDVMIVPGKSSNTNTGDTAFPNGDPGTPQKRKLLLTNETKPGEIPFGIAGYILISSSGQRANKTGYFTELSFYDEQQVNSDLEQKVVRYSIESTTSETVPDGVILQKGRAREDIYLEEKRIEWLGVLNTYSDNNPGVHANYLHAYYQNSMNMEDVTKFTLRIEIESYFPGIYRGQVLPVSIYVFDTDGARKMNSGELENNKLQETNQVVLDEFLSGVYVVMGMNVTYDSRGIRQVLNLCKRSWKINTSGIAQKYSPANNAG